MQRESGRPKGGFRILTFDDTSPVPNRVAKRDTVLGGWQKNRLNG
jgi:hypothetical protein